MSINKGMDKEDVVQDFLGGAMDKHLPVKEGDMGSIPDLREFHLPQSNQDLRPQIPSLHAAATEAWVP